MDFESLFITRKVNNFVILHVHKVGLIKKYIKGKNCHFEKPKVAKISLSMQQFQGLKEPIS